MNEVVRFQRGVYSTVGHFVNNDVAALLGLLDAVNLEDITNSDEIIKADRDAILWESPVLVEMPRDPLWSIQFAVGVKTVNDASGVRLSEYMTSLSSLLRAAQDLVIADYVPVPGDPGYGDRLGSMFLTEVAMDDSAGEDLNTFQMLRVSAAAVRS